MNSNMSCLVGLKPPLASPVLLLHRVRVDPTVSCRSCTQAETDRMKTLLHEEMNRVDNNAYLTVLNQEVQEVAFL